IRDMTRTLPPAWPRRRTGGREYPSVADRLPSVGLQNDSGVCTGSVSFCRPPAQSLKSVMENRHQEDPEECDPELSAEIAISEIGAQPSPGAEQSSGSLTWPSASSENCVDRCRSAGAGRSDRTPRRRSAFGQPGAADTNLSVADHQHSNKIA